MKHYLRGYVERAGKGDGPLRIVAATAGMKGDGLNLTMDGADLARFESNPVVGYGHSYWGRDSLPIGRSEKTWIDGDRLLMDVVFDAEDEFAQKVERKYQGGYLNAFSIGFDVHNVDNQTGVPERWELFEVSSVPLPMDPNAIVEAGRARALADARDETRAGKVLSKANKTLVENAVTALQALLSAAGSEDDEGDDDGRSDDPEVERLTKENERLRRLAGA